MNRLVLIYAVLGLVGCIEGPTGPPGPRGDDGIGPSAEEVAAALTSNHLAEITGPQGEPGTPATPPTPEEVATALVRDHLPTIQGPPGQDGASPSPSTVAQELVSNHLPAIRGPAGAYDAVDANGTLIGRVTGLGSFLWSEVHQGYFWAPETWAFGPTDVLGLFHPPRLKTLHSNNVCNTLPGQTFVDLSDQSGFVWVDPLIIGADGPAGLRGSTTAPRSGTVTILSTVDGDGVCTQINETRSNLVAFDTQVTFPNWVPPMTLVPATQ